MRIKISAYGSATVEELEEAWAFENLKVVPEKSMRQTQPEVNKEKKFTVFRGFPVRTVQGNLSAM